MRLHLGYKSRRMNSLYLDRRAVWTLKQAPFRPLSSFFPSQIRQPNCSTRSNYPAIQLLEPSRSTAKCLMVSLLSK